MYLFYDYRNTGNIHKNNNNDNAAGGVHNRFYRTPTSYREECEIERLRCSYRSKRCEGEGELMERQAALAVHLMQAPGRSLGST
jgi:hypothetical protein